LTKEEKERNAKITADVRSGMTHAEVGAKYDISRARVGGIVTPADTREGRKVRKRNAPKAKPKRALRRLKCKVCGSRFSTRDPRRVTCGQVYDTDTGETCAEAWSDRRYQFDEQARQRTYDTNALSILRNPTSGADPADRARKIAWAVRRLRDRGIPLPDGWESEAS